MRKSLAELVRDSQAGRITDLKDIEEILDKIGKMTWGDLLDLVDMKTGENGILLVQASLEIGYNTELTEEYIRGLGIPEVLCLVDDKNYISENNFDLPVGAAGETGKEEYEDSEEEYEDGGVEEIPFLTQKHSIVMVLLVHLLNEAKKTGSLFRMFFGISIGALFRYWNELI